MRFHPPEELEDQLSIELWSDSGAGDGSHVVTFGRGGPSLGDEGSDGAGRGDGRGRGGGPKRSVAAVVAVAALVGGAVKLGHREGRGPAVADPRVTVPVASTGASGTTGAAATIEIEGGSGGDGVVDAAGSAMTVPVPAGGGPGGAYVPPTVFALDPGFDVYLTSAYGNGAVSSFDVTTGAIGPAEAARGENVYGVVPAPGGPVFLSWSFGGFAAPLGDGTAWYYDGEALVRHTLTTPDTELERVPYEASSGAGFGGIDGTSADGRPTVMRSDGRTYVVAADGSMSRLAAGAVSLVDRGRFVERVCEPDGRCETVFHAAPVAEYRRDDLGVLPSVGFSPDGTHAAVFSEFDDDWRMFDLVAGRELENARVRSGSLAYGPTSAGLGWSADSRFFFFVGGPGLQVYDTVEDQLLLLSGIVDASFVVVGVA